MPGELKLRRLFGDATVGPNIDELSFKVACNLGCTLIFNKINLLHELREVGSDLKAHVVRKQILSQLLRSIVAVLKPFIVL